MKRAWILTGDGINCEHETAEACRRAGFETEILHLSELIGGKVKRRLEEVSLLALPGGFSFGDELGSGRVLALKIRRQLGWDLAAFARNGGIVIGICNGFQTLVSLGAFGSGVALAHNLEGRFINQWSALEVDDGADARCPLLRGIRSIDLPIRHGEGRLLFDGDDLGKRAFPVLRYRENPNGSFESIAGLVDPTGRILGLMPHPEAFQRISQHPGYWREAAVGEGKAPGPLADGYGMRIFKNAFEIARECAS
jgi:phosphoribosylformylglycinamidine synthase